MRCGPAATAAALLDREVRRTAVYLHAGQLVASAEPCAVTTIVGSCVAVCLFDPLLKHGGVNHYLLPYWSGDGSCSPRFGNVAVESLIRELERLGSRRAQIQAKVFGGACVIASFRGRGEHLGTKNVQVARKLLAEHGVPIAAEDVLGRRGRKLVFQTDDGTAWVKDL